MQTKILRRLIAAMAACTAVSLLVTGCGSTSSDGSDDADGVATITIGVLPNADVAPLHVGISEGIFRKHNLEVVPQSVSSGAAIVPSVVSGQYQFGYGGVVPTLTAVTKGLPLQVVAAGNQESADPASAFLGIAVKAGSPYQGWADLSGKRIGVNAVGSLNLMMIRGALDAIGRTDIEDSFEYVEVPGTDMASALSNDRVDAVLAAEPFLTLMGDDIRIIAAPMAEAIPGGTVGVYYTTKQYANQNSTVVDRFRAAMNEALDYSSENPDAVRSAIVDYAQMSPELATRIRLPQYSTDINEPSIREQADLMERYGIVDGAVNVDSYLGK